MCVRTIPTYRVYRLYDNLGEPERAPHRRVECDQGSLAVGAILASLSVRTTTDIFRVGGKNLGMLDASGGSLALLFVDRTSGAGL